MRTLFLCPRPLWPLDTGAKQRDFHLALALAQASETTLLAFADSLDEVLPQALRQLFAEVVAVPRPPAYTPEKLLRGFLSSEAIGILNLTSTEMDRVLRQVLARTRFDTVHISCVHMSAYLATVRTEAPNTKTVCDWHNIESELMRRYASRSSLLRRAYALRTARNLERAETKMLSQIDALLVTSERERVALDALGRSCPVHVVENGVDMARFARERRERTEGRHRKTTILFVGSMDYHANVDAVVDFAASVWPTLKRVHPELTFKIVGRNPTSAVKELAKLDGIVVTGSVDDVGPYYAEAIAAVVPLRVGGGTRLKILEAMGYGAPVVSTMLGIEGLAAVPDRHYLLADTPEAMVSGISRLVGEPGLSAKLTEDAFELVSSRYDWNKIGAVLATIHRQLAGINDAREGAHSPRRAIAT